MSNASTRGGEVEEEDFADGSIRTSSSIQDEVAGGSGILTEPDYSEASFADTASIGESIGWS